MKKKAQFFSMLGMAMAMMPPDQYAAINDFEEQPKLKSKSPLSQKPPSGTREYFFNSVGDFSTQRMLKTECVFKCYAINDKNAKRKFNKWQKN